MLVFRRHEMEVIRIGDDIKITFLKIAGNYCRVGIEAPRGVRVDREEVYETRQRGGMPPITEDYDRKPPCRGVRDEGND